MSETNARQPSLKELAAKCLNTETSSLSPDLERRIRAMAKRWQYLPGELEDVLDRARRNPAGWLRAVALDERRTPEFRRAGHLPPEDA